MFVRSSVALLLLVPLAGCFLVAGEEQDDAPPGASDCAEGERPLSDGTCGAPCGPDEGAEGDECVPCRSGQHAVHGRCASCDDSCLGIGCGQVNACGRPCLGDVCAVAGHWSRLLFDVPPPIATDPTCADVAIGPDDGAPGWREEGCVAWDESSGSFLVFGGDHVDGWDEIRCRPDDVCDARRTCTLADTWRVLPTDDGGSATWIRERPAEAPPARYGASCVATPEGVLLFGGAHSLNDAFDVSYNAPVDEDLWLWRDGAWTRPAHMLGLGAGTRIPAAWDPAAGELVVVSGCDPSGNLNRRICGGRPLDGPLSCAGEAEIDDGGFPWPYGASLAWDAAGGGRMLVVGGTVYPGPDGRGASCGAGLNLPASNEVWALTRVAAGEKPWKLRRLSGTPIPAGETAAMAGGVTEVLRVGGIDRDPDFDRSNDHACLFDGEDWSCTTLTANGGPPIRDQTSLAFGGGRYLLVGGSGGTGYSRRDVWLYDPAGAQ